MMFDSTFLQSFADNYTSADFKYIGLVGNGGYGNEFFDQNQDFRFELCQYLIPQIETANIELIRDLYQETTKCSDFTFSIYTNIYVFAQELLRRDWRTYLIDYMRGASYNMDSYLGTGRIQLEANTALEIWNHMKQRLEGDPAPEEKKLLNGFLQRFEYLANKK